MDSSVSITPAGAINPMVSPGYNSRANNCFWAAIVSIISSCANDHAGILDTAKPKDFKKVLLSIARGLAKLSVKQ
ncbi:hypothetical protein D3C87_1338540 [compost metagenome]